jgi:hypothetical protein
VHTISGLRDLFADGWFLKMSYKVVKFYEKRLVSGINEYGACEVSSIALLQSIIRLLLWVNGRPNPKYTTDFRLNISVSYNLFFSYFSVVPLYACTLEGRK